MSEGSLLAARGVVVRYAGGHDALAGVDLEVARGETLALVGESGSGKTTLLRCFNRLVEPQEGEIRLRDEPIRSQDPVQLRRHIGYVQQDGGLLPHWTVARNVGLVPSLQGWDAARIAQRVREALTLVGLAFDTFAHRYPRRLSGGQRQRVAVARALAADPEVVLLDEPFGALDPISRAGLQAEFLSWKSRLGKTLVLVTHDLGEAFRLGDRIAVLRAGRLEQIGRPEEIQSAPATEHVRELIRLGSR